MTYILIIDDEADVRDALELVLTRAGFDVHAVGNGNEAIEACNDRPPDIVITDMIMPKLDGAQLIRKIKSEHPSTRVIAISGGGNFGVSSYEPNAIKTDAFLAAARAAGADKVLTKPFESEEIVAAVQALIPG